MCFCMHLYLNKAVSLWLSLLPGAAHRMLSRHLSSLSIFPELILTTTFGHSLFYREVRNELGLDIPFYR